MAKYKGRVTFDIENCKGCKLCTYVCPVNIVVIDQEKINRKGYHPASVKEIDKCIACANCAIMCPDTVITIEREKV